MTIEAALSDPQVIRCAFFVSVVLFVVISIAVPMIILSLPGSYFSTPQRRPGWLPQWHPTLRLPLLLLKNIAAILCLFAGVVMLVLPGQGLLTIVVGVLLLDFPGKYRLERWIISKPAVLGFVNRIRTLGGRQPFEV